MKFDNKSVYYILTLLTIYTVGTAKLPAQSEWVLKSTGINFNSVQFYDEMLGWVVGDSGSIIATADGGSNWQCLTSGTSQSLKSVFFINAFTGWAAGNGGAIVKTTNGGINWAVLTTGTVTNLTGIHFPTIDTGYAVGTSLTLKTTNGGVSWTSILANSGSAIFFSTGLKGMSTDNAGYLSKTSNGGTMWLVNTAPGNPVNQRAITFINASTGWTGGNGNLVFKTTNEGVNWVTQTSPATIFSTFYGISFADDLTGYLVGSGGQILKTSNGGTNWSFQTSGTTKDLRSVDFVDDMTGWAVGNQGNILFTSDGGSLWNKQLIEYSAPFIQTMWLYDILFLSEMTGYTCGMDGYINRTTDGGNSWATITTASFNYLFSMYFPEDDDADTGWVCGRLGTIQRTTNAGTNWTVQTTGTSQHLNSITVERSDYNIINLGFCVGDNGTILATDTVGFNWSTQSSGTTNNLNSVHVLNDSDVIIAGNAGTILKTTNLGMTPWISISSGTTEDLKSICFINENTGYVCGTNGKIMLSTNAGESWTSQSSGTTSTLNSIDFEEIITDNGYAAGENGMIVSTSNGGMTWNMESSGSTTTLFAVIADDVSTESSSITTIVKTAGKLAKYAYKKAVTALPVELTSFNYSVNNNSVTLNWQTSGEINNRGFEIERKNSISNTWSIAGFAEGGGTVSGLRNYKFQDKNLNSAIYNYRLKQVDYNGNYEYFNLNSDVEITEPDNFVLNQNYPNPFNPATKIGFEVPVSSNGGLTDVKLVIFDALGRQVQVLLNQRLSAGYYEAEFNGKDFSTGIYFYRIEAGSFSSVKRMILLK